MSFKHLYLDIGNLYTKVACPLPYKKEFFLSAVENFPPPHPFFEFDEKIYIEQSSVSKRFLVGWPAALVTDEVVGMTIHYKHYEMIFIKALFDNLDDGDESNIYLSYDFGENATQILRLAELFDEKELKLNSGFIYDDRISTKNVKLKIYPIPSPLCLYEFYLNSLPESLHSSCAMIIVDIGYIRSKVYIIDNESGLKNYAIIEVGTKLYYDQIYQQLKESRQKINPFLMMQDLEVNYPIFTMNDEQYNVEMIFKNISWDSNKDIFQSITSFLKDYYHSFGHWVDALVITGGGSSYIGDLLHASLAEKEYSFSKVIIDKKSRFSVINGIHQSLEKRE